MLVALAAVAGLVAACAVEDGHTPTLRKGTPSTAKQPTAEEDPSAPPAPPASSGPSTVDASTPSPVEVYVSDLDFTSTNGYGPLEKDMSNGEDAPNDGTTISLGAVTYTKGLGVHAGSEVTIALGGAYKTFIADVGVDDEVEDRGSVVFQVVADGATLFDSDVMTGTSETKKVSVDVTGKQELKLLVNDAGDGIGSDHADWAGARLVK